MFVYGLSGYVGVFMGGDDDYCFFLRINDGFEENLLCSVFNIIWVIDKC